MCRSVIIEVSDCDHQKACSNYCKILFFETNQVFQKLVVTRCRFWFSFHSLDFSVVFYLFTIVARQIRVLFLKIFFYLYIDNNRFWLVMQCELARYQALFFASPFLVSQLVYFPERLIFQIQLLFCNNFIRDIVCYFTLSSINASYLKDRCTSWLPSIEYAVVHM